MIQSRQRCPLSVIHRVGDLETPAFFFSLLSRVIHRVGDLEKAAHISFSEENVIHRVGDLEIVCDVG